MQFRLLTSMLQRLILLSSSTHSPPSPLLSSMHTHINCQSNMSGNWKGWLKNALGMGLGVQMLTLLFIFPGCKV